MPQTKKQEIVYTVMMVCVMVYLLSVRVDDVPVDELFRHAALQGQPQRELFRHVGADHGDELSRGIFVAAVRRGPAGAVRVWQGSGRYEKRSDNDFIIHLIHRQKKHKPDFVPIKLHKNHLLYLVIVL